jgi:uncharacterized protein YndB with AHSA1/START domain
MGKDVTVRKKIAAPIEKVFEFWTHSEHVRKWWGPPGVTCSEAEINLVVGGGYRIANRLPDGSTIWIHGQFEVIEIPTMLRYTWGIGLDSVPDEVVTVTFASVDGGTEVVIVHENAPDNATAESHVHGWHGCLDGLQRYAEA